MSLLFVVFLIPFVCSQEPNPPNWPSSVHVLDPSTPGASQQVLDSAFAQNGGHVPPFNGQWSSARYAFLFKPGTHSVNVNVGFYTSVIGLGTSPDQTYIPFLRVDNGDFDYSGGALDNFWRSAENFATGTTTWAVSQACPLRRMLFKGDLTLYQYNSGCCAGYASGGYLSDSTVTGTISTGSQQQWFTRNTNIGNWQGGLWNMVFVGNSGTQVKDHCGVPAYTSVSQTPVIAEKPYITIDNQGKFSLRVPNVETNKVGPTTNWANMVQVDFSKVYVAQSTDSVDKINAKIASGLHLVLTPGNYQLAGSITITNPNTVVLGIGFPTLTGTTGKPIFHVTDVPGVRISGVIIQAGQQHSPSLIQWGDSQNFGSASNPGIMYDIFARVGGTNNPAQYQVSTDSVIVINHKNVILDNSWLWRADHDITGNVVNSENPSKNGLVVNGDSVITYGLAVEHHLQDGVVWNGNGGQTFFFQCELPYDVTQQNFGNPGYAGYRINSNVNSHTAYGIGVYSYFRDYVVQTPSGIVAPASATIVHPFTKFLNANGGIKHIVNGNGQAVNATSGIAYLC